VDKLLFKKANNYLILLSIITVILLFYPSNFLKTVLLIIVLLILCLPIFYVFYKLKNKFAVLIEAIFFVLLAIIFILTFRKLRDSLPPPAINQTKIIAYTQYFGYPFYLDTAIFLVFIFFPIIVFSVLRYLKRFKQMQKYLK